MNFYCTDIDLFVHLSLSFCPPLSLCWIDLHAPSVESVMTAGALSGGGGRGRKKAKGGWVAGQKGKRVGRVVQVLNLLKKPLRKSSEAPETWMWKQIIHRSETYQKSLLLIVHMLYSLLFHTTSHVT